MRHADLQTEAVQIDRRPLQSFESAHGLELDPLQLPARTEFVSRAERGLHHAARSAEDDAGTGRCAQRSVELLVRQPDEVDVGPPDEPRQLALLRYVQGDGHAHLSVGFMMMVPMIAGRGGRWVWKIAGDQETSRYPEAPGGQRGVCAPIPRLFRRFFVNLLPQPYHMCDNSVSVCQSANRTSCEADADARR